MFALANVPAFLLLLAGQDRLVAVTGCLAGLAGTALLCLRARWAVAGFQASLGDCSRQRAQLRAVVETAGDAILTCDADGRVLSANGSASRLFGWRASEFPGLALTSLLPTAPLGQAGTDTFQVLGAAAAAEGRRKDGSLFPVAVSISKVRVEGRKLYLAIIHDLTDLADARSRAEQASRSKSAFLRHMSHELRTPLNGILGMAAALSDTALDPAQARLVGRLAESGESLLAAMEQMTDLGCLARLPLARQEGRPVLVAMCDAAERRAVENVLRGLGLLPTGVSTGRAALAELARSVVEGSPFGLAVLEQHLPDIPEDDWLAGLLGRSGWDGPVLLLRDDDEPGFHPACVRASLHRREAGQRLGDLVGRHLARA